MKKDSIDFKLTEDSFSSGLDLLILIVLGQLINYFLIDNFYIAILVTIIETIIFYMIYGYKWFKDILFKNKYLEIIHYYKRLKKISKTRIEYNRINKIFFKDRFDRNPAFIKIIYDKKSSVKIKISENKDAIQAILIIKKKSPNEEIEIYPDYCDVNEMYEKELKRID